MSGKLQRSYYCCWPTLQFCILPPHVALSLSIDFDSSNTSPPLKMSAKWRYFLRMELKKERDVNIIWKILHIAVFAATIVAGLSCAWSFINIYNMFDYNCILYAKVRFREMINSTEIDMADTSYVSRSNISTIAAPGAISQPNILKISNGSRTFLSLMWVQQTVFATDHMCNLLIFSPIASMTMATVFAAIMCLNSRGGAGLETDIVSPWTCVYPVMIMSVLIGVFCMVASAIYTNGMEAFCARWEMFTGVKKCSKLMDKFTLKNDRVTPFYNYYLMGSASFRINSYVWLIQGCLMFLRVFCSVDFYMMLTRIKAQQSQVGERTFITGFDYDPSMLKNATGVFRRSYRSPETV